MGTTLLNTKIGGVGNKNQMLVVYSKRQIATIKYKTLRGKTLLLLIIIN